MFRQYDEEEFILSFFKETGTFLDIGAYNGVEGSNTRQLALNGWTGVCLEPNPVSYFELRELYAGSPRVVTDSRAVSRIDGWIPFHLAGQLSTKCDDTYNLPHMHPHFYVDIQVKSISPATLVSHYDNRFDFISVDAEGSDLEIVKYGEHLFPKAKLVCFEHALPGRAEDDPKCVAHLRNIIAGLFRWGLTRIVHRTEGNTFLAR